MALHGDENAGGSRAEPGSSLATADTADTAEKLVRAMLVDDQERARQSLRALLSTCSDIEIVAEARDGGEAVRLAGVYRPDVALMDLKMPSLDGIEAMNWIKVRWPETSVLVLTMFPDRAADAMEAGADEFLLKGSAPEKIVAGIRELGRRDREAGYRGKQR